jgi:Fe-S-cluster containining protein
MVPIGPHDDAAQYQTATCYTPGAPPYLILDRRDNGECVYLGAEGCTIWHRAPQACRAFDCREYFASKSRNERRDLMKRDSATGPLFERGRELLKG